VPDAYRGETVKAFVVPRAAVELTEEKVIEFCRQKLAAYKAPKTVVFRKEQPKSAVGKILRRALREEGRALAVAPNRVVGGSIGPAGSPGGQVK
jgi:long-chain acyl-CoA synthetase